MPPKRSFDRSLEAIHYLVKELVDPAFLYSDFNMSEGALVDLVALEIICTNSTLDPQPQQLNETQQQTLLWEGTTRRFKLSFSDHLSVCHKAFSSLLNSETDNDYAVEKYLVSQLVNALKEAEEKQLDDITLQKNIARIETRIKFNVLLNSFFQYLKVLNNSELQDKGLANLLSKVDSNKGLILSAEKLVEGPLALLEEVSLYLAEQTNCVATNETQLKKKAFLLRLFKPLKEINLLVRSRCQPQKGHPSEFLYFNEVDRKKINALFTQYAKQVEKRKNGATFEVIEMPSDEEETPLKTLNVLKQLFAMEIWNTQAKDMLGKTTPQGIKEIREILNDETLLVERRFVSMMVVVAKRLEKPIGNRSLLVHQLYVELKRKIFTKYFPDLYKTIAKYPDNIETAQYQKVAEILTLQSRSIIDAVATIQAETTETAIPLKETIQRIPTKQIKELLTKLCHYFPDKKQLRNNKASLELKELLSKLSQKLVKEDIEDRLELIKEFVSLYMFLKYKVLPHTNKAIKLKDYLLYQDLFTTLLSVIKAFRDDGYQALLDKLYCHKDLHGRKLLAALQSVESDKVMAFPILRSVQDLFPIDAKIEFALVEASKKLDSLVPYSQRWLGPLANTPLGKTLHLFKEEVQKKSKESFFVPTGIKQLKRLFEKWDSRNPLDLSEKETVIELLKDIIGVLKKRAEANSKGRSEFDKFYLQLFIKKLADVKNSVTEINVADKSLAVAAEIPSAAGITCASSDACDKQKPPFQERRSKVLPTQSDNRYTLLSGLPLSRTSLSSSSGYGSSPEIERSDEKKIFASSP